MDFLGRIVSTNVQKDVNHVIVKTCVRLVKTDIFYLVINVGTVVMIVQFAVITAPVLNVYKVIMGLIVVISALNIA
jgi:hypothetical protein